MTIYPNLVTVGMIDSGATAIQVDLAQGLGNGPPVKVTLSANYQLLFPGAYPTRPGWTGAEVDTIGSLIASGTTFAFLEPEAAALVTAGAASYA